MGGAKYRDWFSFDATLGMQINHNYALQAAPFHAIASG